MSEPDKQSSSNRKSTDHLLGAGVIWSFWEGQPPDVVLRCFESIRVHNSARSFIVLSQATLPKFLDEAVDYPLFHGRRGTPADFSKVQYLADWVRLTLLEKYGGIWLDASVICTSAVDNWIVERDEIVYDSDEEHEEPKINKKMINMFPMHANGNVHGNWAMAALEPGNPVVKAWRQEMNDIFNEIGPGQIPTEYVDRVMAENPTVRDRWNNPAAPPLPYLWVYLALQVVLHRQPELHSHICLHSCTDGPMYRRYQYNVVHGIQDGTEVSQKTADHLAREPLHLDGPDRWFIKLVGTDRRPVQEHLDRKTYREDSGIGRLSRLRARTVVYGSNLRTLANLDRVRAAVHLIVATRALGENLVSNISSSNTKDETTTPPASNTSSTKLRRGSKRESVLMDFQFGDASILKGIGEEEEQDDQEHHRPSKRASILVGFDIAESPKEPPAKRESICFDFYMDGTSLEDDDVDDAAAPNDGETTTTDSSAEEPPSRRESIYSDKSGAPPTIITIL